MKLISNLINWHRSESVASSLNDVSRRVPMGEPLKQNRQRHVRGRPKKLASQTLQGNLSLTTQACHHFFSSFTPEVLYFSPCSFHGISDSQMETEDGAVASSYVWDFLFFSFVFLFEDIFKPRFCDLKTINIDWCDDFYVISPEFQAPNLTRLLHCFTSDMLP